jgi:hypothetical protein
MSWRRPAVPSSHRGFEKRWISRSAKANVVIVDREEGAQENWPSWLPYLLSLIQSSEFFSEKYRKTSAELSPSSLFFRVAWMIIECDYWRRSGRYHGCCRAAGLKAPGWFCSREMLALPANLADRKGLHLTNRGAVDEFAAVRANGLFFRIAFGPFFLTGPVGFLRTRPKTQKGTPGPVVFRPPILPPASSPFCLGWNEAVCDVRLGRHVRKVELDGGHKRPLSSTMDRLWSAAC